jgi:hypothetical protein
METTSRYEKVTITNTTKTTIVIGINIENAANPNAGNKARSICSLPYAEDEIQSEDKTPNAYLLLNL